MADVLSMRELAKDWGWILGGTTTEHGKPVSSVDMHVLEELLDIMLEESQPGLPSGFIELNKV
jgi:hypothetical protein